MRWMALAAMMAMTACGGIKDAGDTAGETGTEDNLGADIYADNCQVCHGASGEGGTGVALAGGHLDTLTDDDIRTVINDGAGMMPSFSLTTDQVDDVIDFMRAEFGG